VDQWIDSEAILTTSQQARAASNLAIFQRAEKPAGAGGET